MVRLPRAPTACEVVLVGICQDKDGLEPGCRWVRKSVLDLSAVSGDDVTDGLAQYASAERAAVNPGAFGAPLRGCGG